MQNKTEPAARKRALVSCDRCKTRRTRCIRAISGEPCKACKTLRVACESKLPRKQRVYGSVETLSLRFRALESLMKGLFPNDNVQDTETLFRLAATRNIAMPATDDFTASDIFSEQRPALGHRHQHQHQPQSYPPAPGKLPEEDVSLAATATDHNPFLDAPTAQPVETLIPVLHEDTHYFGPSSSFHLATTIRSLVLRCNAIPEARSLLRTSPKSPAFANVHPSSNETYTSPLPLSTSPNDEGHVRKRARTGSEIPGDQHTTKDYTRETIADFLPSRSVADALASAFFEHVHLLFPVFDRSQFQCKYETTFARNHELIRENEETGWLCCLALVFSFGAHALEKHDPDQARVFQKKYLGFVHDLFQPLSSTTAVTNIQALVLLQLYDQNAEKRDSSWILIGTAARMAISLGMHREGTDCQFDPIERSTRKLVWAAVYSFEKFLCVILGRPSCIDDAEVSIGLPDAALLHEITILPGWIEKNGEGIKMSYQMVKRAYPANNSPKHHLVPISTAKTLLKELDDWHTALPEHLKLDSPGFYLRSRGLLLHVHYYFTRCLFTRDYLIQKVESNICRIENKPFTPGASMDMIVALSEDCINTALESLKCLIRIDEAGGLSGVSWIDIFYVFHSVLIVCVDFLARPKDQPESPQDVERKDCVRKILYSSRVIKMASTYHILGQITIRFASITGALDETYTLCNLPTEATILSPTLESIPSVRGTFTSIVDVLKTNNWNYQNEDTKLPWDFFDLTTQSGDVNLDYFP
ncbi:hypothetical protein K504DRAFT_533879 [Pleomassaria siparia CBS 279.74]|uniref:Zn(2)-C6 fungal-type domain-containing protein n=1 Tax=Pleomassaria siparia CBS 279.74 TaxID=1314801 RepID=A0A6G1K9N3_9PLEO|nr:hypothetical protein K504DRAFT_533879 [Pleomassaria siparia CBS 279.74]